MVITCENIGFITRGLRPLVINPIFSLVMPITTHDIFQYFCQPFTNNIHKFVVMRPLCKKIYILSNCTTPGKRYWKILRVVMVITSESIEIITSGRRPRVINSILSQVITITTSNIFQYLLSPEWCNNIP